MIMPLPLPESGDDCPLGICSCVPAEIFGETFGVERKPSYALRAESVKEKQLGKFFVSADFGQSSLHGRTHSGAVRNNFRRCRVRRSRENRAKRTANPLGDFRRGV